MRRRGIRMLQRHAVVAVQGDGAAQTVEVAPVDADWRPLPTGRFTIPANVVGLGFGVRPNIELTRLVMCEHDHDPARGGWHARRSTSLETTVAGLFVAGDGGGIGGVDSALAEGAVVAHSGRGQARPAASRRARSRAAAARRRLAGLHRFRAALADWSAPRPGIFDAATADTLICRCEDVSRGELAAAIEAGYTEIGPLR
ncbi:MAG: hypothetical protein WDO24_08300 [Pseudomonadota bacterium]